MYTSYKTTKVGCGTDARIWEIKYMIQPKYVKTNVEQFSIISIWVNTYRLVWKLEKNDCYSVRHTYRLYIEDIVDNIHSRKPGHWSGI